MSADAQTGKKRPLKILEVIESPTGFVIAPVHYSMDPEKDGAWLEREIAKYRRDNVEWLKTWAREMEIDFTAVSGAPAFPNFSEKNLAKELPYNPSLPLCLCCDFNVEPMVWLVAQVVNDKVLVLDEIVMSPGTVEEMVREFRNRYPAHPADIWVYGDATGRARTAQTARSCYDILRLAFRGYPVPLRLKVPLANPSIRDSLNAVNLKLMSPDGDVSLYIDQDKCPELIKDMKEVVTKADGTKIVKVDKREDPYFWRTHAADALRYFIAREWPTVHKVYLRRQRVRPRLYSRLLGEM